MGTLIRYISEVLGAFISCKGHMIMIQKKGFLSFFRKCPDLKEYILTFSSNLGQKIGAICYTGSSNVLIVTDDGNSFFLDFGLKSSKFILSPIDTKLNSQITTVKML